MLWAKGGIMIVLHSIPVVTQWGASHLLTVQSASICFCWPALMTYSVGVSCDHYGYMWFTRLKWIKWILEGLFFSRRAQKIPEMCSLLILLVLPGLHCSSLMCLHSVDITENVFQECLMQQMINVPFVLMGSFFVCRETEHFVYERLFRSTWEKNWERLVTDTFLIQLC